MNCTATVLTIKHLADSRHPPANIAGVLELFFHDAVAELFREPCHLQRHRGTYLDHNQTVALLLTTLDNAYFSCNLATSRSRLPDLSGPAVKALGMADLLRL